MIRDFVICLLSFVMSEHLLFKNSSGSILITVFPSFSSSSEEEGGASAANDESTEDCILLLTLKINNLTLS